MERRTYWQQSCVDGVCAKICILGRHLKAIFFALVEIDIKVAAIAVCSPEAGLIISFSTLAIVYPTKGFLMNVDRIRITFSFFVFY